MILKARFVLPVSSSPIENGAVEIHESKIVAVRRADKHESDRSVLDCGDALILPGFINAHTHLELTHLAGRTPPNADFTGWLARVLAAIRADGESPESVTASALEGAALSLAAGVTTIGDVTRRPDLIRPVLRHGRLRVISFGEVIAVGAIRDRLDERLRAAADQGHDSERLSAAISPHALYTCDRRAIRACVTTAAEHRMRLCTHLAETVDEEACALEGRGALVEFGRSLGVWNDEVKHPGLRPVPYAAEVGLLSPRAMLAHVNYATDEDIALIARHGAHVAYCPRTHAAFGHAAHRFRDMLRAGLNVCVGTDSLASNPSLSVLDELRFLRRGHADLDVATLLQMGTLNGACALGLDHEIGTLDAGKTADLVVVPYDPRGARHPAENLLAGDYHPAQVFIQGRRVK